MYDVHGHHGRYLVQYSSTVGSDAASCQEQFEVWKLVPSTVNYGVSTLNTHL